MDRNLKLQELLLPVRWHPGSTVRSRQNLVCQRRKAVLDILPFLDAHELIEAQMWLNLNKFSDLWD